MARPLGKVIYCPRCWRDWHVMTFRKSETYDVDCPGCQSVVLELGGKLKNPPPPKPKEPKEPKPKKKPEPESDEGKFSLF